MRTRATRPSSSRVGRVLAGIVLAVALVAAGNSLVRPSTAAFNATQSAQTNAYIAGTWTHQGTAMANSPLFYYRLDDAGSTTVAADASGNNQPGILRPGSSAGGNYQAGGAPIGGSDSGAQFTTSSSHVTAETAITSPGTFSVELWFKTSDANGGTLIAFGDNPLGDSGTHDRQLYIDSGGRLTFGIWSSGSQYSVRSASSVTDGSWHYVAATTNGTTSTLYVDGLAAVSAASTTADVYTGYWKVGGETLGMWSNQPTNNYFNGTIDEVAVYGSVLSAGTVTAHRTAVSTSTSYPNAVLASSPVLYWRLDDPAPATRAVDSSGNGRNGGYYLGPAILTGQPGALSARQADNAMRFDGLTGVGYNPVAYHWPNNNTVSVWFRTTTKIGGLIFGLSDDTTQFRGSFDRVFYMSNDGTVTFGIYPGYYPSTPVTLHSSSAYNDGAWHMGTASIGPSGTKLYVDGALLGSVGNTYGFNIDGYWHFGGGYIDGSWPGNPTSQYFSGSLDEFIVFGSQLPDATVAKLYQDGL